MIAHYPTVLQRNDRTTVRHGSMMLCSVIKGYNTGGGGGGEMRERNT